MKRYEYPIYAYIGACAILAVIFLLLGEVLFLYFAGCCVIFFAGHEFGRWRFTGTISTVKEIEGVKQYKANLFWDGIWPFIAVFGTPAVMIYIANLFS